MSKSSKARSKELRLQKKRASREANRLLYEARKQAGKNFKSKRAVLSARRHKLVRAYEHPNINCGNLGCKACFTMGMPNRL